LGDQLKKAKSKAKRTPSDCTIPPPIAAKDLPSLVLPRSDEEVKKIAEYVAPRLRLLTQLRHGACPASEAGCLLFLTRRPAAKC